MNEVKDSVFIASIYQSQEANGVRRYHLYLHLPPSPPSLTALPSGTTYTGEVPNEDVHEKNAPSQAQPTPSAPPISSMDHVTGYETAGFQAG